MWEGMCGGHSEDMQSVDGMTKRCICKCSEDVQTCFFFCVDVLYVLSKCHSSVVGYFKCGGVDGAVRRDQGGACIRSS